MVDKRTQIQQAYDEIAETYHAETEEDDSGLDDSVLRKFIEYLPDDSVVLDAGCGGDPVEIPQSEIVGIDISRGQVSYYTGDDAELVQGDISVLPFDDNSFDGSTAFYSLIHIPLDDHQTVIDELIRVLKPGSPLLLVEGTEEWVGSNESWLESGEEMHWEMAGKEQTRTQLETAGCTIEQITPVKDTLGDSEGTKLFFLARTGED